MSSENLDDLLNRDMNSYKSQKCMSENKYLQDMIFLSNKIFDDNDPNDLNEQSQTVSSQSNMEDDVLSVINRAP